MKEDGLLRELRSASTACPEGLDTFRCISIETVARLSDEYGMPTGQVSIFALENGLLPLRYARNAGTIGLGGQARLLESKVMVAGAGGIGGNACEMLARMGVGEIVIADPDRFCESNLNRQDFSDERSIGLPKVSVLRERLTEINGDVGLKTHHLALDDDNLPRLLKNVDVALDALDSFEDRLALQRGCRNNGVVLVHGAIAGTCLQATTVYPEDPGVESLFRASAGNRKTRGIEVEVGNPATTPALVAAIQVQEALKVILGDRPALRGRLLYLDLDDWTVEFIELG